MSIRDSLEEFFTENKFGKKGTLCVALVVTQHARSQGLPLNPQDLLADSGGQVQGLGKAQVQSILAKHNISKVLASEGGRTSRGSIANMKLYVAFLNEQASAGTVDLDAVEKYWIEKVRKFFAGKPFKVSKDSSKGVSSTFRDLFQQAEQRRKEADGMQYVGALMQHLVGAKLDCAIGSGRLMHNSFSTSDQQTGRKGDFEVGNLAIHVTTTPSRNVLERCKKNLQSDCRPILITLKDETRKAEVYAEELNILGRVEIFEVQQFLALNTYEIGLREGGDQFAGLGMIIERYNEIIGEYETDPSLMIEIS